MSTHLEPYVLVTRRSPLALAQAKLAAKTIEQAPGGRACTLLECVTTGDRRLEWSLEKAGGKGLFTSELEEALTARQALVAVHSAKDLPTELGAGLVLAGCLCRADARDVLVRREGVEEIRSIATSSPRRRIQLSRHFAGASFTEIRGNVGTRLRKLAEGAADASVLAAAGLARLGIESFPGLLFETLDPRICVPAVGQAAIALQCRQEDRELVSSWCHAESTHAVVLERLVLERLGGGCQTAVAVHVSGTRMQLFHEACGLVEEALPEDPAQHAAWVDGLLQRLGIVT
jgi:hydroxymethylbilane synthase